MPETIKKLAVEIEVGDVVEMRDLSYELRWTRVAAINYSYTKKTVCLYGPPDEHGYRLDREVRASSMVEVRA